MLFGRKKQENGTKLSKALTKDERDTLVIYLAAMSAGAEDSNVKSASQAMAKLIQDDEPIIGPAILGLINVCKTIGDAAGRSSEAQGIVSKLERLL